MLKYLFLLSATLVLFSSCSETPLTEEQKFENVTFDVNGKSDFTFINQTEDTIEFYLMNLISLPGQMQEHELFIAPFDTFQTSLKTQGFHYYEIYANDTAYKIFSAPGASIIFNFDLDSTFFTNDFDSINNYLKKSSGSHYRNYETTMNLINQTRMPEIDFQGLIKNNDEIIKNAQRVLLQNRNYLPDWYVLLEHKRLSVLGASFKLNSLMYRKRMLGLDDHIPENYLEAITKDVPYLKANLMGFTAVHRFYMDFSTQTFSPMTDTNQQISKHRMDSLLATIKTMVPQPFSDYVISHQLSQIIRLAKPQFKMEWTGYISDTTFKNLIINQYSSEDILPKGVKLPHFIALTTDSNEFDSDQLKDSIVLINFWASYCAPCIDKFKLENELAEYFKNKPVKIINMCIETEWYMFTNYSHKLTPKTFNLFANSKISKQLNQDFGIDALPHSVLVDTNGLIIQNRYHVQQDSTQVYIESLLQ